MRHFKAQTMGHAIIMGRTTHESIGRALPGRRNIVLSRRSHVTFPGCEVAASLEDALTLARTTDDEPFVIGGAAAYAEALPKATRLLLTCILREVPGDVYFPEWTPADWREVSARPGEGVVFRELARTVAR
jgi:dihydrofolate reductase